MPEYILTYARVVILKRRFFSKNKDAAEGAAFDLELAGELGLDWDDVSGWRPKPGSEVDDIQDEENVWEVTHA